MSQRALSVALTAILLSPIALLADEDSDADLKALQAAAEAVPKETKGGRMVEDRAMAQSMIEYGRRAKNPEVMLLAVEILHKNPVTAVKGESNDAEELEELINEAVAMRPEDETLIERAEMALETLEETTRGLAGGPRTWVVAIDKGKYYQLDPRLVYNAHEKAIVVAYAKAPSAMLGGSVRRGDQRSELTRGVGKGKVQVEWNAGITTTGWDVRIYNLSGADGMQVKVETN